MPSRDGECVLLELMFLGTDQQTSCFCKLQTSRPVVFVNYNIPVCACGCIFIEIKWSIGQVVLPVVVELDSVGGF